MKSTVLEVFNKLQLDDKHNLEAFARKFPRDFYNIAAKLIPQEVTGELDFVINWNETKTYDKPHDTDTQAEPGS